MSVKDKNNVELRLDVRLSYREYVVLRDIAAKLGMDIRDYTENIIRQWVLNRIKGLYRVEFDKLNVLDLAHLFGDLDEDANVTTANSKIEKEKAKVKEKYKDKLRPMAKTGGGPK